MKLLQIRASSLPGLWDCSARWFAQNVEMLKTPNSGPAHLGNGIHHASGKFDQAGVEGASITPSDAVDLFVDYIKTPTEEVVYDRDLPQRKVIDVGTQLTLDYVKNVAPTRSYSAVELKCEPLDVGMPNGVTIRLTGQADRVRVEQPAPATGEVPPWWEEEEPLDPRFGISDLKSGKRIINSEGEIAVDKHIYQLGQYELIGLLAGRQGGYEFTLPAEVIALPTSGKHTKVAISTVDQPSKILLGEPGRPGLLHAASLMAEHEMFIGNPKSILCSEKYCPRFHKCWWRGKEE